MLAGISTRRFARTREPVGGRHRREALGVEVGGQPQVRRPASAGSPSPGFCAWIQATRSPLNGGLGIDTCQGPAGLDPGGTEPGLGRRPTRAVSSSISPGSVRVRGRHGGLVDLRHTLAYRYTFLTFSLKYWPTEIEPPTIVS
jgi:hypothetical protein